MMSRHFIAAGLIAAAFFAGRAWPDHTPIGFGPSEARAQETGRHLYDTGSDQILRHGLRGFEDGGEFISTSGGNAYLWRRVGDQIELVGQCAQIEEDISGQASYLWLPGVERRP